MSLIQGALLYMNIPFEDTVLNVFVGLYNHCIQKRPEKKDFIEQDVSPSRASSANRERGGEGRSYIPVPRQRDIGAPVPGTVKQVRGEVEEVKGSD